jgi:predicted ABC-type ATPase
MQRDRLAILDGFPRSEQEATALVTFAKKHGFQITILHFMIRDPKMRHSFSLERQRSRAVATGHPLEEERYQGKTKIAERFEEAAINICHQADAYLVKIDPRRSLAVVTEEVRRTLRVSLKDLPWNNANISI